MPVNKQTVTKQTGPKPQGAKPQAAKPQGTKPRKVTHPTSPVTVKSRSSSIASPNYRTANTAHTSLSINTTNTNNAAGGNANNHTNGGISPKRSSRKGSQDSLEDKEKGFGRAFQYRALRGLLDEDSGSGDEDSPTINVNAASIRGVSVNVNHTTGVKKARGASRAVISGEGLQHRHTHTEATPLHPSRPASSYGLVSVYTSVLCFMLGILDTVFWPFMAVHITEGLGMTESQLGFVMAAYASPNFITFAFLAQLLNLHGPWKVISLGGGITSISALLYSTSNFYTLVFAGCLHGFGWCLLQSGIQALISQYPDKMQTILAANNMAQMTGGLTGPILGVLFSKFIPPLVIPGVCVTLAVIGVVTIMATELGRFHSSEEHSSWNLGGEDVSMKTVLRRKAVLFGCLGVLCSYILNGFLMVGSFTHVKQALQISTSTLAIIFVLPQMVYSFTAGCTALLGARFTASLYACIGTVIMGISLICLGPAPFLLVLLGGNPDVAKLTVLVSLLCFEVGSAVFYMPLVPMMQLAVGDLGTGGKNSVVSLYILVQGIGELFGRGLSGLFIQYSSEVRLITCSEDTATLAGGDSVQSEDPACMSSFPIASMYLGTSCVCIALMIVIIRSREKYMQNLAEMSGARRPNMNKLRSGINMGSFGEEISPKGPGTFYGTGTGTGKILELGNPRVSGAV